MLLTWSCTLLPCFQAMLDYMRTYKHTADQLSYMSSSLYWTGAYVLADVLATEGRLNLHVGPDV